MRSFFDAQVSIELVAVCVLGAALVLFVLYRWRLRLSQALQADLMRQIRERSEQLEEANQKLAKMSYVDAVTEVANRRSFEEQLTMEWRRSMRAKSDLSLLMADIDGFKAYNDALGHQAGDESLKKVAATIDESARRAGDVVARYGGEEFAILLPDTDNNGAAILAERIRATVEARNIWHPSTDHGRLTISIGVATMVAREDLDGSALVKAADEALYRAKRDGRNLVRVAENTTSTPTQLPTSNSQLPTER
jgi:diguanylate cyclase (GGDEF)-like protein